MYPVNIILVFPKYKQKQKITKASWDTQMIKLVGLLAYMRPVLMPPA